MITPMNRLYCGDNLDVMRHHIPTSAVDLIYLDPPFNTNRSYDVFDDTWRWTPIVEQQYDRYVEGELPGAVANALRSFRLLLGENDPMAYLVNMAPRLVEMYRVLKPTGSIYLHCDWHAGHYLKQMLDKVFGENHFQNEIIWYYRGAGVSPRRWGRRHDTIFFYTKGKQWTFNADPVRDEYAAATKERFSHYIGNVRKGGDFGPQTLNPKGKHPDDVWEIPALAPSAKDRLGYPTQKPLALLDRIIAASTDEGDIVLDPFCGSGTTIAAAIRAGRSWIGIDVSDIAIGLVNKRLHTHGSRNARA